MDDKTRALLGAIKRPGNFGFWSPAKNHKRCARRFVHLDMRRTAATYSLAAAVILNGICRLTRWNC